MSLLATRALSVALSGRPILEAIDLEVAAGELLGLIGPNGAGKTTLLRTLASLVKPSRGEVLYGGQALADRPAQTRAQELAYLPQGGECHWSLKVEALVMLGRLPHQRGWRAGPEEDRRAVARAMEATDVTALAGRPVDRLSGGERARVLLARALAGEPRLLLADEPVAGLDPYHRLEVMEHLRRLTGEGVAVVVVLHDLSLAARFCHRLVLLHQGRIAAMGPPEAVTSADNLAATFRIRAYHGRLEDGPFVVPTARLPADASLQRPEVGP